MKNLLLIILATAAMLSVGCGGKASRTNDKGKSPAFMFWCFRTETVSAEYHVPEMATPAIATYLQNRMKGVPGYEDSTCDLASRTLTINYQSTTVREMNFEEAIALAGFAVNNRPASPSAKIPEGLL